MANNNFFSGFILSKYLKSNQIALKTIEMLLVQIK